MTTADRVADAVLAVFDGLPENRKPVVRSNGVREWVPLSGIVAECSDGGFVCLALATGMKCLPASRLPAAKGVGIHDWHAEVLALRAFNRFVLNECRDILLHGGPSSFLQWRAAQEDETATDGDASCSDGSAAAPWNGQPFEWREGVALHMYCSEAPCGDASMELTMAAQADASPWAPPTPAARAAPGPEGHRPALAGRGYFSRLGTVRRKPGRGDAPPTLSKSCSDKLALRQCTTLLGGLASLLVAPGPGLCLQSVVVPAAQHSEAGCRRCFSADAGTGRMAPVAGRTWPGGYAFTPLAVQTTSRAYPYAKRSAAASGDGGSSRSASSNVSVAWTANGVNECLVNGVLRGRKAFDPAGASAVSRRQMWTLARDIADRLALSRGRDAGTGADTDADADADADAGTHTATEHKSREQLQDALRAPTYAALKTSQLLLARERVKDDAKSTALQGWVRNEEDADWGLDTL